MVLALTKAMNNDDYDEECDNNMQVKRTGARQDTPEQIHTNRSDHQQTKQQIELS